MPHVADGTLVPPLPQETSGFPKIPGVVYNGVHHTGDLFDYGPDFDKGFITVQPPKLLGSPYPVLVPKADADGNDMAGIRRPELTAPVATYTGWALRADGLRRLRCRRAEARLCQDQGGAACLRRPATLARGALCGPRHVCGSSDARRPGAQGRALPA